MNKNPPLVYACSHIFYTVQLWKLELGLPIYSFCGIFLQNCHFFRSTHLLVYDIIILQYHLEVPNGIRAIHSQCSLQLSSGRKSIQPKGIREKEIITVPVSQILALLYELCIQ